MNLARRALEALALVRAPRPQRLAGGGVSSDDGAPLAGSEVEDAVDHDRRRLGGDRLRRRAEVVELPGPGDLQVVHVLARDLVERRVARAALVGRVGAPLAVRAAFLSAGGDGTDNQAEHELADDVSTQ